VLHLVICPVMLSIQTRLPVTVGSPVTTRDLLAVLSTLMTTEPEEAGVKVTLPVVVKSLLTESELLTVVVPDEAPILIVEAFLARSRPVAFESKIEAVPTEVVVIVPAFAATFPPKEPEPSTIKLPLNSPVPVEREIPAPAYPPLTAKDLRLPSAR
jgi:hypothetical protein